MNILFLFCLNEKEWVGFGGVHPHVSRIERENNYRERVF